MKRDCFSVPPENPKDLENEFFPLPLAGGNLGVGGLGGMAIAVLLKLMLTLIYLTMRETEHIGPNYRQH